jgi:hypothetical protein
MLWPTTTQIALLAPQDDAINVSAVLNDQDIYVSVPVDDDGDLQDLMLVCV